MLINASPCTYRDYGSCIIAFSNANRSHFILQDIYAEFFRAYYINALDETSIVKLISKDYGVSESVVSRDLASFFDEIRLSCSNPNSDSSEPSVHRELSDNDIYSMMSNAVIPFSATIEITDACNLKCIHCYRSIPEYSYWNINTFESALASLKSLGTLHLTLTGGEPFLHPNFKDLLQLVNQYGFVLTLQTNATFDVLPVINQLINMPLKDIAISLYSTSPKTHDAITGEKGSCKKTIEGLTLLTQNGIPVTVNCPVMSVNRNDMQLVKDFSDSLGIPCNFSFKIIPSQNMDKDTQRLNCFSTDFLYECIVNPKINLYKALLPDIRKAVPSDRYCQTGFRSITFDAQGNALLCNAYRKICGCLKNESVEQIWTSSKELLEWRNNTSKINSKCKSCKAFAYCEPCPAHEYTLTEKEDAVDALTCSFGKSFFDADERVCSKHEGGEKSERVQSDQYL